MNLNQKIAIVLTSTGWGGLELNTLKLAKGLQEKGCVIHFIVRENSRVAAEVNQQFEHVFTLSKVKKYVDFKNAKIVNSYLENNDIAVVFTSFRPDLDLLAWTKRRSKHVIKLIHQQQMQIGVPKKGMMQRIRYKAIDHWIAPLQWLKEEVLQKTTIEEEIISIIPLGVDVNRFIQLNADKAESQKMFDCSTSDTLLGVIGRIDEKKGQLFLVKAIERLRQLGENVSLLIVGEPTINDPKGKAYYDDLMRYIAENDLGNYVFMADFTTNVAAFYNAIDVFVMSSVGETYGMVTLEALLSKVPVIGTNSGGTPELLGQGKFGELYEVDDIEGFCVSFQTLMKRIDSGELNLDEIQSYVVEHFRLENEVNGIYELIHAK